MGSIATSTKLSRWMDQSFLFVVLPDGQMRQCVHIADGSQLAGIMSVRSKDNRLLRAPVPVESGNGIDVDAFFEVPDDAANLRLIVLGSSAVPVVQ